MPNAMKLMGAVLLCLVGLLLTQTGMERSRIEIAAMKAYAMQSCLPPTANAGPDQTVQVGQTVQLDGSKSSQPSGCTGSLSFGWAFVSKPSSSQAKLSDPTVDKPTFVTDVVGEFKLRLMVKNQAGSDAALVNITSTAEQPPVDGEFNQPKLDMAFITYIPTLGPTFSLTANPGHLRMELPATATFDHWTSVDAAPQLRLPAPSGNWEVTTKLKVLTPTSQANYHAGLMVVFSQFNLFYWGNYQGAEIRMERSGARPGISSPLPNSTAEIELMIAKEGNTYTFSYRAAGTDTWMLAGGLLTLDPPQFVGLIGKTWGTPVNLVVDFDYLRVTSK